MSWDALMELAESRRSVKKYDPTHQVDDATLEKIFGLAALSPSAFNLQHWRFVVARDPAQKKAMRAAAFDQPQVEEASCAVVVAGKLSAYEDAAAIYAEAPDEIAERMVGTIHGLYGSNPQMARDEAVRGASLAAMSLMYAVRSLGLDSGPMIGFDPVRMAELVGLPEDHAPVMLVVIGKQVGSIRPRMSRLPLSDVVKLERFDGHGLLA